MTDTSAPALRPGGGGEREYARDWHGRFAPTGTLQVAAGIVPAKDPLGDLPPRPAVLGQRLADRARADAMAKKLGFPAERVVLNYGEPDKVIVGGKILGDEAGHFDPHTGLVTADMQANGLSEGVMSHEIMHAKYERVMREYSTERNAAYGGRTVGAKADAPLTAAQKQQYPTLAALHDSLEGDGIKRLGEEDGISSYSHDYWKALYHLSEERDLRVEGARSLDSALTETQAEWSRLETTAPVAMRDQVRRSHPAHYKFYQAITAQYARLGSGPLPT